eukprot:Polyplicarium_translucidae@DN3030_c0_g1_i2.p1
MITSEQPAPPTETESRVKTSGSPTTTLPAAPALHDETIQWVDRNVGPAADLMTGEPSVKPDEADLLWQELKKVGEMYTPRCRHGMVFEEGKVYVHGGDSANFYTVSKYLGDLYEYSTDSGVWRKLVPASTAPSPRAGHVFVARKKRLHAFGGMTADGPSNELWTYDPGMNVWAERRVTGDLPDPRSDASGDLHNGCLWVYGGCDTDPAGCVWKFDLKKKSWERVLGRPLHAGGPLPSPRSSHLSAVVTGALYIHGGRVPGSGPSGETWKLNLDDETWELLTPDESEESASRRPQPRFGHAGAVVGSRWVIHGGRNRGGDTLDSTPLGDALPACLVP